MKWFSRSKPPDEKSPGGSLIYRHDSISAPRIGLADEAVKAFRQTRDEAYQRLYGEAASVSHEIVPLVPHIDVITYHRIYRNGEQRRQACTLVTSGMSDLAMTLPNGIDAIRRAELIFYCDEPKQDYIDTIRWLAHFPHNQNTCVGYYSTIPNGNPPEPFWGSPILDTILLLPPIVTKDQKLPEELVLGGDPVHFLWIVPVTTPECNLKLAKGGAALLDLFQAHHHPHIFDPGRKSYV
ncbi:MAG TPA: suppressor of fused domain protein [Bryobacteraceae bacterium]|jgi:hypothetical protein